MIMLNVPGTRMNLQNQMAAQQAIAVRNMDIHNARVRQQPWVDNFGLQNAYSAFQKPLAAVTPQSRTSAYKRACARLEQRSTSAVSFKEWQKIMGELIALDQAQVEADIAEVLR